MAENEEEKKPSAAGQAGSEIGGRLAEKGIGKALGGAGASGASGAAGSAAGGGAAAAGGAAAGGAGGAAAGAGTGAAAGGPFAPITAVAGAIIGFFLPKLLKWGVSIIGGLVLLTMMMFAVFLIIILGGGSGTAQASPVASGLGLKDNFCQGAGVEDYDGDGEGDCSRELKNLILRAASWARMPAAVLNGSALIEGLDFSLTDEQVVQQAAPGGRSTPCAGVSTPDGPMQFSLDTWRGNNFQYGNAAIEAGERADSYTTDRCNILDALFAAAKLLKLSTGKTLDDTSAWTDRDVENAGAGYYTGGVSCVHDSTPGFNYCEVLLGRYKDKRDEVVGDVGSPQGKCPVEGVVTGRYGEPRPYRNGIHEGVDIQSPTAAANGAIGDQAKSTISGRVTQINNSATGNGGAYIVISNDQYEIFMAHVALNSFLVREGDQVSAGQSVAVEDSTGVGTGPHVHYEVHEAAGAPFAGARLNPEPFLPIEQRGGSYYCKEGATGHLP